MYFLFDIGGTTTRCAITHDLKTFEEPMVFPTPQTPREGLELLLTHAKTMGGGGLFQGICGGMPGIIHKNGVLIRAPHLSLWQGTSMHDACAPLLEKKDTFYLVNDTVLVGLGEAGFGAGKDHTVVAYITISTGVGGARIVHKQIDTFSNGFEPGFHILDMQGEQLRIAEELLSGSRLEKEYGTPPYAIDDPMFWDARETYLARFLHNTVAYWMPDVLVLGGSMVTGDRTCISLSNTETKLKAIEVSLGNDALPIPPMLKATLGSFGGLYGALGLLQVKHNIV